MKEDVAWVVLKLAFGKASLKIQVPTNKHLKPKFRNSKIKVLIPAALKTWSVSSVDFPLEFRKTTPFSRGGAPEELSMCMR